MSDPYALTIQALHDRLHEEQRPVLGELKQPGLTILNAVPGSGKTETVASMFVAAFIESGHSKSAVKILSYTNAAVGTAQDRARTVYKTVCGEEYPYKSPISRTIHSYTRAWISNLTLQPVALATDISARFRKHLDVLLNEYVLQQCAGEVQRRAGVAPRTCAEMGAIIADPSATSSDSALRDDELFAHRFVEMMVRIRRSAGSDSPEQLGQRFCKALRFDDARMLEANGIAGVEWAASQTQGDDKAVKAAAQICEAYRSEKMLADEPFDLQIMSGAAAGRVSAELEAEHKHDHLSYLCEFVKRGGTFGGPGDVVIVDEAQNVPRILRQAMIQYTICLPASVPVLRRLLWSRRRSLRSLQPHGPAM